MTLEERVTRLEVEFARRNDQDDRVLQVVERLTVAVRSLQQTVERIETRMDRMETRFDARFDTVEIRLTNLEADVALIKGWLAPPSADGSGA